MQTNFPSERLVDPAARNAEKTIRTCVHCGFCTATCPTYLLNGNELDSPRGRIYLIKEMLEKNEAVPTSVVGHIDACLSCLSCTSTCPSGVDYMHLIDQARAYIAENHQRSLGDRSIRLLLSSILPYPKLFRGAMQLGRLAKPHSRLFRRLPQGDRIEAMLGMVPNQLPPQKKILPSIVNRRQRAPAKRVIILKGCAQSVLRPSINEATTRVLQRLNIEVVDVKGEGCCGALVHHMGDTKASHKFAQHNIDKWLAEIENNSLDAILVTASGCGTTVKDYGFMFRNDPLYAAKAKRVSELSKDITEYLATFDWKPKVSYPLVVAYHPACSLQHGQKIRDEPRELLGLAGYELKVPSEAHICCGSAGVYNILQPDTAKQLRDRKVTNIERLRPDVIATGNIGCISQIAAGTGIPVVHTIELLDMAMGGPVPPELSHLTQLAIYLKR